MRRRRRNWFVTNCSAQRQEVKPPSGPSQQKRQKHAFAPPPLGSWRLSIAYLDCMRRGLRRSQGNSADISICNDLDRQRFRSILTARGRRDAVPCACPWVVGAGFHLCPVLHNCRHHGAGRSSGLSPTRLSTPARSHPVRSASVAASVSCRRRSSVK